MNIMIFFLSLFRIVTLVLTALDQEPIIPKSDILPVVDISVKTLKNPNKHIFATRNNHENI